jgi:hypothetical protein
LARRPLALLALLTLPSLPGCGYHSVYAAGPPGKLHVTLARTLVADAVAADEVAAGVREELAKAGALESGEGYPRVEIEVLRAEESSEGISAGPSGPLARGTGVGLVARAWVAPAAGEQVSDTGDVRAEETMRVDPTALASGFHHADALRAAARRLGHTLGARILGLPAASEEGP